MHKENADALPVKIPDPPKLATPIIKIPKTKKGKKNRVDPAMMARASAASAPAMMHDASQSSMYYPPPPPPMYYAQAAAAMPPPPPPQKMGVDDGTGKKSKKSKGKKDEDSAFEAPGGKRKKGSSSSSKRSKSDAKNEMMYEGMQGQAQGYNVLSSTFPPYDWAMRSPLMGPTAGGGGVPGTSASAMPQCMVDWGNFRSKSPPAYGQQGSNASAENWMRSKSPMPPQAANGHLQYSMITPEMAAMGYGQEAQMYPQMMYDPNYGMTVSAHQQLSPNSQRKMMANEANMYMTNQMGFTGFFPGQQHTGYMTYAGTGEGMAAGGHQGGVPGQHGDAYAGFEGFGVQGFENMGDHAAMMMGMNHGGNPGEHE